MYQPTQVHHAFTCISVRAHLETVSIVACSTDSSRASDCIFNLYDDSYLSTA